MRNPARRTLLATLVAALVAAAVVTWWTADRWLPQAGPWTEQAWKKITRPGPGSLPPGTQRAAPARAAAAGASQPVAPQPRKCVKDGRTTYTDQPCPPGSQEQVVDGAVTSLPRAQ